MATQSNSPVDSPANPRDLLPSSLDIDCEVSESEDSDYDSNLKPKLPYVEGCKINIAKHEPPTPFGPGYDTKPPPMQEKWATLSQAEYCLSCSPTEGRTVPGESQCLTITSIIRTGYDRGAQLVEVNRTMVAKIYDPLYYSGFDEFGGRKQNVVQIAEGDYSREAAAYEKLQSSTAASAVTPAYFGSWTTEVETVVGKPGQQTTHKRQVRLILIERLHGECMDWVAPCYLRKAVRSLILKKALHAEAIIYQSGINHRDFAPRNIMILGTGYDDPYIAVKDIKVDVKLIDFNFARILHHPHYVKRRYMASPEEDEWFPKLQSPIVRFYGRMMDFSTAGWCSNEDEEAERWLWKHFHNDPRYIPVIWDPIKSSDRPRHQERRSAENSSDSGISVSSGQSKGTA